MRARISGSTIARKPTPSTTNAVRQPHDSMSHMASGTTSSWPAAIAPPAIPMARPRRVSNQRDAITAAIPDEAPPAPTAMMIPTVAWSCQSETISAAPSAPTPSRTPEAARTTRPPQRSARRPITGPAAPLNTNDRDATRDSAVRPQPNSASIGLMKTPKALRTPVAASRTTAVAPRTTHA